MTSSRTVIIVPTYNCANTIEATLRNIEAGLKATKANLAEVVIADDGSKDKTLTIVREMQPSYEFPLEIIHNSANLGLTRTLRSTYQHFALDETVGVIIKTDPDNDFDHESVLPLLIGALDDSDLSICLRQIDSDVRSTHEQQAYNNFLANAPEAIANIDPSSCGSQGYNRRCLEELLLDPFIRNYQPRWGLDFALAALAVKGNYSMNLQEAKGSYEHSRRSDEKVNDQFAAYQETLDMFRSEDT